MRVLLVSVAKKLCAVFNGKFCGFEKQWKEESIKAKKYGKKLSMDHKIIIQ
jgi:hypothetical protein